MDWTIGKSQNRNYDGERLMMSLLKIAQNINEVDDDKTIEPKEVVAKSIKEKKDKPIKESKKHPLKEIYDRTYRSLKWNN